MDGFPRNRRRANPDAPRPAWTGPERRRQTHYLASAFRSTSAPTPTPPPVAVVVRRSAEQVQGNARTERAAFTPPALATRRPRARLRWVALALGAFASAALLLSPRLDGRAAEPRPATVSVDAAPARPHEESARADVLLVARPAEPATPERDEAEPSTPPGASVGVIVDERADARIKFKGYAHLPGGVLYVPKTFSSEDGAYDLLLHFHGNTGVVVESAERAGLNAIVAIINLGTGSGAYESAYASPGLYEALLDRIHGAVAERGLAHGRLRRVALSSWSAGYGALSSILEWRTGKDALDALLVLDGIHCGFVSGTDNRIKSQNLAPFVTAARNAADNKLLFSITHSDVEPITYASSSVTAEFLLDAVGGHRNPAVGVPEHVALRAAIGAVSKKLEKRMEPESEGLVGSFHVRGYRGNTAEHHMAHLLQMAATALPELRERWSSGE